MGSTRRTFLGSGALAAGLLGWGLRPVGAFAAPGDEGAPAPVPVGPAGYRPVVTPNGATLPFRVVAGVKVFHLVAEEVQHEFAPGLTCTCWGYNGRVHGPTIEAVEGDRIRVYVTNRLPAPTTVHWHGLYVANGMDGVGGLTQRPIEPGETFRYELTLAQHGTFMYHSHHDEMVQIALGMMGMIVVHPKAPESPPPDRDYVYMLSEWAIRPGLRRPDPNEMTDFNVLTFNGRAFPGTAPMVARRGDRVRIRIGNLSPMDHHPIHLHGHHFVVVATDGGVIPAAGRWPETTVLVPTGSVRVVELVADNPGDWAFHCHMTHHTMTQMGHGIPNLVGVDPTAFDAAVQRHVLPKGTDPNTSELAGETPKNSIAMLGGSGPYGYIPMGGMFTVLKVRDDLRGEADPGDYAPPRGTVAEPADPAQLAADGVDPGARDAASPPTTAPSPATPPAHEGHHGHGAR